MYTKNNPDGDPFKFQHPPTLEGAMLCGMGRGLYWGEGTKVDKNTVKLGNTDAGLIKKFLEFLTEVYGVKKADCRFSLQLFSDVATNKAMDFWIRELSVQRSQFYKTTITRSTRRGSYRKKSEYGVLTVYYHNKKLRDILVRALPM